MDNALTNEFSSKHETRNAVWDQLAERKVARFPFPPHGRIPNFAGAREASERLLAHPLFANAKNVKVNPDAPQRYVREAALRRGIVVYLPTPQLRGGFKRLDPATIPEDKIAEAASLSRGQRWATDIPLEALPPVDLIVTGSVAVTRRGFRCGKGHGYGDLEYAILRELGHPPVPVMTTVHSLQLVRSFPREAHDLPVSYIVTPSELIEVAMPPPPPDGIDWERITHAHLETMPVLKALRTIGQKRKGLHEVP